MQRSRPESYDALVVGIRCAGAATAMLLARRGLKVLAIDRDAPGSDTMSTHALMRGAVMQLDRWGILPDLLESDMPAIRRTTFFYGTEEVPLEIAPSFGVDALIAPRRFLLDAALARHARAAGVELRHHTHLLRLAVDAAGRVTGAVIAGPDGIERQIAAGIVIGADGRRSSVARRVDAPVLRRSRHMTACVYGYFRGLADCGYRWFYRPDSAGGAIPTNDDLHCVFAALPPEMFERRRRSGAPAELLQEISTQTHAGFGAELAAAEPVAPAIVFRGQAGHIRQSFGPGWALVGDAGYFKDPITAHGITDALRDAEILADAIAQGGQAALGGYQSARDALSQDLFSVTDRIASFGLSLAELQFAHRDLNRAMKQEQEWMSARFAGPAKAA